MGWDRVGWDREARRELETSPSGRGLDLLDHFSLPLTTRYAPRDRRSMARTRRARRGVVSRHSRLRNPAPAHAKRLGVGKGVAPANGRRRRQGVDVGKGVGSGVCISTAWGLMLPLQSAGRSQPRLSAPLLRPPGKGGFGSGPCRSALPGPGTYGPVPSRPGFAVLSSGPPANPCPSARGQRRPTAPPHADGPSHSPGDPTAFGSALAPAPHR